MHDRHVVITGGTGGLGGAVTRRLLAAGAHVHASYFNPAEADALRASLPESDAGRLTLVSADLRQEDAARSLIDGPPKLDALVHLVGGFTMGPLHTVELDAFRAHHELNVTITFLMCKHALRRMRDQGSGRIVTVSSRAALEPTANMAVYASAKAAVLAMTRAIADETRGTDVTANCVLPSVLDTPANRAAMGEDDADTWVTPDSLAGVIEFLASDAAGDMRGTAVRVYGSA